ncbi:ubiquinol-cytochrome c reductase iron-sulfur subunit [Natronoglycomyces albus]|uniref:cytochrome bc1 complex Rieske iron-sulfur subunit n=1 Tax=Natronoglycomyces albus TaxID=2811108 RepID=UPI001FE69783|nr:Rieske 2Fe-2S domain-containing protein [Natronoglycomyces albus]
MSENKKDSERVDLNDPKLTRFDIYKEALRKDDIEILHYEPRFPTPGTKEEKRMERIVAMMFVLAGLFALGFVAVMAFWPWEYPGEVTGWDAWFKWQTPMLGITLGLSLAFFGIGILTWAKKLLPVEEFVQDRHDGGSSMEDRKLAEATIYNMTEDIGLKRRPLLKKAFLFGAAPLGLAAVAPLGGLIKDPGDSLTKTGFHPDHNDGQPVRLMNMDGSQLRPDMVSVGGQVTAFPAIPGGATNKYANSSTLLIHLRDDDAAELRENLYPMYRDADAVWGNFVAYSKICTHVGCPASLYEQHTHRLLCPCHQSQFNVVDNAAPVFGPAARHLPMLPISVDEEGYFYATQDYLIPVGPAYWNRPSLPEEVEE